VKTRYFSGAGRDGKKEHGRGTKGATRLLKWAYVFFGGTPTRAEKLNIFYLSFNL